MAYSPGDHQAVHFACFLDPESWGAGGVSAPPAAAGAEGRPPHPGYLLATGGVDHVKFWSAEGATLTGERGLWGPDAQCQPMLCGAGCGRLLLTGGVSGHVYVWRGRRVERTIRAHESLVTCLWADPKVGVLSGGGDGMVKLYSPKMEHQRSYGVAEAPAPPLLPATDSGPPAASHQRPAAGRPASGQLPAASRQPPAHGHGNRLPCPW